MPFIISVNTPPGFDIVFNLFKSIMQSKNLQTEDHPVEVGLDDFDGFFTQTFDFHSRLSFTQQLMRHFTITSPDKFFPPNMGVHPGPSKPSSSFGSTKYFPIVITF